MAKVWGTHFNKKPKRGIAGRRGVAALLRYQRKGGWEEWPDPQDDEEEEAEQEDATPAVLEKLDATRATKPAESSSSPVDKEHARTVRPFGPRRRKKGSKKQPRNQLEDFSEEIWTVDQTETTPSKPVAALPTSDETGADPRRDETQQPEALNASTPEGAMEQTETTKPAAALPTSDETGADPRKDETQQPQALNVSTPERALVSPSDRTGSSLNRKRKSKHGEKVIEVVESPPNGKCYVSYTKRDSTLWDHSPTKKRPRTLEISTQEYCDSKKEDHNWMNAIVEKGSASPGRRQASQETDIAEVSKANQESCPQPSAESCTSTTKAANTGPSPGLEEESSKPTLSELREKDLQIERLQEQLVQVRTGREWALKQEQQRSLAKCKAIEMARAEDNRRAVQSQQQLQFNLSSVTSAFQNLQRQSAEQQCHLRASGFALTQAEHQRKLQVCHATNNQLAFDLETIRRTALATQEADRAALARKDVEMDSLKAKYERKLRAKAKEYKTKTQEQESANSKLKADLSNAADEKNRLELALETMTEDMKTLQREVQVAQEKSKQVEEARDCEMKRRADVYDKKLSELEARHAAEMQRQETVGSQLRTDRERHAQERARLESSIAREKQQLLPERGEHHRREAKIRREDEYLRGRRVELDTMAAQLDEIQSQQRNRHDELQKQRDYQTAEEARLHREKCYLEQREREFDMKMKQCRAAFDRREKEAEALVQLRSSPSYSPARKSPVRQSPAKGPRAPIDDDTERSQGSVVLSLLGFLGQSQPEASSSIAPNSPSSEPSLGRYSTPKKRRRRARLKISDSPYSDSD